MYSTLKAEVARKGLSVKSLSAVCNVPQSTLYDKLHGKSDLTLGQAISIRKALGIEMDLEELFAKE